MRVLHVVLVSWTSGEPPALGGLVNAMTEIPGLLDISSGPSVSPEGLEADYEWGLVVTFESPRARDGYLDHELHLPVATLIGAESQKVVVFDLLV